MDISKFHSQMQTLLTSSEEESICEAATRLSNSIREQPWLLYTVPSEQRELFIQKMQEGVGTSPEHIERVQQLANAVFYQTRDLSAIDLDKAYKDPFLVLDHLVKFKKTHLIDQSLLVNIVKKAAELDGYRVSENIKSYGIKNPSVRAEIAQIAAQHDSTAKNSGTGISFHIQNYQIEDEVALITIALLAAENSGSAVSTYIDRYKIQNPQALEKIALVACKTTPAMVINHLDNYFPSSDHQAERQRTLVTALLLGIGTKRDAFIIDIQPRYREELEGVTPKDLFATCLQMHATNVLPTEVWTPDERTHLIEQLLAYEDHAIAASIAVTLLRESGSASYKATYDAFLQKIPGEKSSQQLLSAVLIAAWIEQAKKEGEPISQERLQELGKRIASTAFAHNWLLSVIDMNTRVDLSPLQKIQSLIYIESPLLAIIQKIPQSQQKNIDPLLRGIIKTSEEVTRLGQSSQDKLFATVISCIEDVPEPLRARLLVNISTQLDAIVLQIKKADQEGRPFKSHILDAFLTELPLFLKGIREEEVETVLNTLPSCWMYLRGGIVLLVKDIQPVEKKIELCVFFRHTQIHPSIAERIKSLLSDITSIEGKERCLRSLEGFSLEEEGILLLMDKMDSLLEGVSDQVAKEALIVHAYSIFKKTSQLSETDVDALISLSRNCSSDREKANLLEGIDRACMLGTDGSVVIEVLSTLDPAKRIDFLTIVSSCKMTHDVLREFTFLFSSISTEHILILKQLGTGSLDQNQLEELKTGWVTKLPHNVHTSIQQAIDAHKNCITKAMSSTQREQAILIAKKLDEQLGEEARKKIFATLSSIIGGLPGAEQIQWMESFAQDYMRLYETVEQISRRNPQISLEKTIKEYVLIFSQQQSVLFTESDTPNDKVELLQESLRALTRPEDPRLVLDRYMHAIFLMKGLSVTERKTLLQSMPFLDQRKECKGSADTASLMQGIHTAQERIEILQAFLLLQVGSAECIQTIALHIQRFPTAKERVTYLQDLQKIIALPTVRKLSFSQEKKMVWLVDYLSKAEPLMPEGASSEFRVQMINKLVSLTGKEETSLHLFLQSLGETMNNISSESEKLAFLDTLSSIKSPNILQLLQSIDVSRRKEFVDVVSHTFNGATPEDVEALVTAFSNKEQWDILYARLSPLLQQLDDLDHRMMLIRSCNVIPFKEWDFVFDVSCFLPFYADHFSTLVSHFALRSPEEKTTFLLARQQLLKAFTAVYAKEGLVADQRQVDEFLCHACSFQQDVMDMCVQSTIRLLHKCTTIADAELICKMNMVLCQNEVNNAQKSSLELLPEKGFLKFVASLQELVRCTKSLHTDIITEIDWSIFNEKIPHAEWGSYMEKLLQLTTLKSDQIDLNLFVSLRSIPPSQWEQFVHTIKPVLDRIDDETASIFLTNIKNMPPDQWELVVHLMSLCIDSISSNQNVTNLIQSYETICQMTKEEQNKLVNMTKILLEKKICKNISIEEIELCLSLIRLEKIELFDIAVSTTKHGESWNACLARIIVGYHLPQDKLSKETLQSLELCIPIFCSDAWLHKGSIQKIMPLLLQEVPCHQWIDWIQMVDTFSQTNNINSSTVLNALQLVNLHDWPSFLQMLQPLIVQGMHPDAQERLCEYFSKAPVEERETIRSLLLPCLPINVHDIESLINILQGLSKEDKVAVLQARKALFTEQDQTSALTIIKLIASLVKKQEEPISSILSTIPEELSTLQKLAILFIHDKYRDKIDYLPMLLPTIHNDMHENSVCNLIDYSFAHIPHHEIAEFMQSVTPFIQRKQSHQEILAMLSAFNSLPAGSRTEYSKALLSIFGSPISLDKISLLRNFITQLSAPVTSKEELVQAVIEKLRDLVKEATLDLSSRKAAIALAKTVIDSQDLLNLSDESPLVQMASGSILWLEGNSSDNYYVHARMLISRAKSSEPIDSVIEPVNISLASPGGKATIIFNPPGLIEGVHIASRTRKTYKELQDRIAQVNMDKKPDDPLLGPSIFKTLFARLQSRLTRLEQAHPSNAAEIRSLLGDVHQVAENFTHPILLTEQLMNAPFGGDNDLAPRALERLYAIAATILQEDDVVKPGQLLSAREMFMMTYLRLIAECVAGQEEGIDICYLTLKTSKKLLSDSLIAEEGSLLSTEATQEYLADIVQKVMGEVLESPETLRNLGVTEQYAYQQGVHQAKYLKNVIGREGGINHIRSMDAHAHTISKQLQAQSRDNILRVFFRACSASVVKSLIQSFNTLESKKKTKLYNQLNDFLQKKGVNPENVWKVTDEGDLQLTEFGAIALLEKGGYLVPQPDTYKRYIDLMEKISTKEQSLQEQKPATREEKEVAKQKEEQAKQQLATYKKEFIRAARTNNADKQKKEELVSKAQTELVQAEEAIRQLEKRGSPEEIERLTTEIRELQQQLTHLKNLLDAESAVDEIRPPTLVVQDQLLQQAQGVPADIQQLKVEWENKQSSLFHNQALLRGSLRLLEQESGDAKDARQKEIAQIEAIIAQTEQEVNAAQERYMKAQAIFKGRG